eukprot:983204-Alexandrium_andersonii.AAC.1
MVLAGSDWHRPRCTGAGRVVLALAVLHRRRPCYTGAGRAALAPAALRWPGAGRNAPAPPQAFGTHR